MGKLLILHCLCPPSSDGYLVHESKVGSTCAGCAPLVAACQGVKCRLSMLAWKKTINWYLYLLPLHTTIPLIPGYIVNGLHTTIHLYKDILLMTYILSSHLYKYILLMTYILPSQLIQARVVSDVQFTVLYKHVLLMTHTLPCSLYKPILLIPCMLSSTLYKHVL